MRGVVEPRGSPDIRELLEQELTAALGRTLHGWIGEAPEGPTLKNLAGVTARLGVLRRIRLDEERRRTAHANCNAILARAPRIPPAHGRQTVLIKI